ncbi:DUF4956 domain-containing protein [Flavobacteriaceae bacterium]|jgi:hypothetical protein|nr:DUF4956 domain-containing protein [Flavobacteriaceae bacterium]|tara:strand:- start:10974 stop:11570 length:597 start_codon:yes stop_codon:yes gene_type:complete
MEFFGIPLFDDDFYKMIFRFLINIFFLTALIKYSYYKFSEKADYLFTFYLIGTIVFFLCFTLKKYEIDLGLALGLFAIFGILRYRTDPLKVREMTYLFVVIGLSLVNALSNKKMSYTEIFVANTIVVAMAYFLDRFWSQKKTNTKDILYESLEHIRPEHHEILKTKLEEKLGFEILSISLGQIDFKAETVKIKIRYKK